MKNICSIKYKLFAIFCLFFLSGYNIEQISQSCQNLKGVVAEPESYKRKLSTHITAEEISAFNS